MRLSISCKGLQLHCHLADDVPSRVWGDPTRLRQVLFNLVGNAVKFTAKGQIDCSVCMDARENGTAALCFAVRDTGIGIAANQLGAVFEAFSQVDTSVTRKFGGTGLGLSISTRLVERMGGHLDVQSELGKGSIFSFTVVFDIAEEAANHAVGDTAAAASSGANAMESANQPPQDEPGFDYAGACKEMDAEVVEILIPAFLGLYVGELTALRKAIDAGDAQVAARCAHGLMGILGNFGARPAQRIAAELDALARAGDLARTSALFLPFTVEIENLANCLRQLQMAFVAGES